MGILEIRGAILLNIEDTTKLNLILTKDIDNIETEEGLNELKDRIYKAFLFGRKKR